MYSYSKDNISDRDRVLSDMCDLWCEQLSPEQWPEPLRQTFAMAYLPCLRSGWKPDGEIPPMSQIEYAKGLRPAEHIWAGCMTIERVPNWVREVAEPTNHDSGLEGFADHVRHHLLREVYRRQGEDPSRDTKPRTVFCSL